MNRNYSFILLAAGLALLCTLSFRPRSTSPRLASSADNHSTPGAKKMLYYWYNWPSDVYNDYASLPDEEDYWWDVLDGVLVNTNPLGGTIVAKGFQNNAHPHNQLPYLILFAHPVH